MCVRVCVCACVCVCSGRARVCVGGTQATVKGVSHLEMKWAFVDSPQTHVRWGSSGEGQNDKSIVSQSVSELLRQSRFKDNTNISIVYVIMESVEALHYP